MKTAMQELIDKLEYLQRTNPNKLFIEQGIHHGLEAAIKEAESMLEKEKQQIKDAWIDGDNSDCLSEQDSSDFAERYYNITFNNEK
jgi:hypothetical protein